MAADDKTSTQRPALTSQNLEDEIEEILARRSPLYASGSDMAVDTATGTPKQLVEQILSALVKVSA
jgi:shikimate kinase